MEENPKIIFIGLSGSGKTKVLFQLVFHYEVSTLPTIGFNVETLEIEKEKITIFDIGGKDEIIELWKHYYSNLSGIVFVIDRNNKENLDRVIKTLSEVLENNIILKIPIAFFMNKSDLEEKINFNSDIHDAIGDQYFSSRKWKVFETSIYNENSIVEGIKWLIEKIKPDIDVGFTKED